MTYPSTSFVKMSMYNLLKEYASKIQGVVDERKDKRHGRAPCAARTGLSAEVRGDFFAMALCLPGGCAMLLLIRRFSGTRKGKQNRNGSKSNSFV